MQPAEQRASLPTLVYVIAAGIFLMGTTEFLLAGMLPEVTLSVSATTAIAVYIRLTPQVVLVMSPFPPALRGGSGKIRNL